MAESIHVVYAAEAAASSPGIRTIPPTADALQAALDGCAQGALLAIGGDGFTPPLSWRTWVRALPRFRPGLGEVVRTALLDAGHPGAALVAVEGAMEGGRIVLVAPDDAAVRDAALGVLSELSGASQLSVPAIEPASLELDSATLPPVALDLEPDAPAEIKRVSHIDLTPDAPVPASGAVPDAGGPWRRALDTLGWGIDPNRWGSLPAQLDRVAPVKQVLASAGERRRIVADDGVERVVCGFPDLRRPESKVLSVAVVPDLDGNDSFEVLALHRHPGHTGTCTPAGLLTPASDLLPGPVCVTQTGRAPSIGGELFAVDGRTVYLKRGRAVVSWDGREEKSMGTTSQALASLVLRWSGR